MGKLTDAGTIILLAVGLSSIAAAQSPSASLADYGRAPRKHQAQDVKQTPRVYDNDNLPSGDTVNVVGTSPASVIDSDKPTNAAEKPAGSGSDAKHDPDKDQEREGKIAIGQSPEERQRAYEKWNQRIAQRQEKVDQLARELSAMRQNAPMSVVLFHLWPDDQLYLQSVNEKQKALDQARADLGDLQEQARRAGVPSSYREGNGKMKAASAPEEPKQIYADVIQQQQVLKARLLSSSPDSREEANDDGGAVDDSKPQLKPDGKQKDAGEIKIGQSPEDRQRAYAYWRKRVEKREHQIDQLTLELDDLKRNLPTAVIWHLWPEDKIYLQIVIDKQKELDGAKADLGALQEQCRKAGVPSSYTY
jgi:thymidylate synthase